VVCCLSPLEFERTLSVSALSALDLFTVVLLILGTLLLFELSAGIAELVGTSSCVEIGLGAQSGETAIKRGT
jgi:hypothetical protein